MIIHRKLFILLGVILFTSIAAGIIYWQMEIETSTNKPPAPTIDFIAKEINFEGQDRTVVADRLLLQLQPDITEPEMEVLWQVIGAVKVEKVGELYWLVYFDDNTDLGAKIVEIRQRSEVVAVEFDDVARTNVYQPNDYDKFGTGSYWWEIINAKPAWEIGINSFAGSAIKVGVADTQVDSGHIELTGRVTTSATFTPEDHGTHVSGVIAAKSNNGVGVASMGHNNVSIESRRTCIQDQCPISEVVNTLEYLRTRGVRVINMSLGSGSDNIVLRQTVQSIWGQGIIMVAAAGNNGTQQQEYPSSYDEVIGVASVGSTRARSPFSDYGPWVDVAAPGQSIVSTTTNDTVNAFSGTSMSAPFVSGLAALCFSVNPSLTGDQVRTLIRQNAAPNNFTQYGLIDAQKTMAACQGSSPTPTNPPPTATLPQPTATPTTALATPTTGPTSVPTTIPTVTARPSSQPTVVPTQRVSITPSPTRTPTVRPTLVIGEPTLSPNCAQSPFLPECMGASLPNISIVIGLFALFAIIFGVLAGGFM
jgi:hypothetical protein